jgi:hypothetical protein
LSFLPKLSPLRPSAATKAVYRDGVAAFCATLLEVQSRLDFAVGSRGWAYVLEGERLIDKHEIDLAEKLINDCRKNGDLPLDICSEDEGRAAEHLESIDDEGPKEFAQGWIDYLDRAHQGYTPFSFWDDLDVYVQMTVEKVDLKNLFAPVCAGVHIATFNVSGWNDINCRAAIMRRFARWEALGKQCVLLHCGDHDPGGLRISNFIRSNMEDLSRAVGWHPRNLIIDRFGLNAEFIRDQGLTWIDNLETGSGERLDDPDHPDHYRDYVQSYLAQFGARKVEANALVVRPEAGRHLCRRAILAHIPASAIDEYAAKLARARAQARAAITRLLRRR